MSGSALVPTMEYAGDTDRFLADLDRVLSSMSTDETSSYQEACRRNPGLQTDRSFKLKFLQAERFQPGLAAHRMAQYFEAVKSLFGSAALGKTLELSDMIEPDLRALASGGFQVIAPTVATQRNVAFFAPKTCAYHSVGNMLRAMFYMVDVLSRDPVARDRGISRIDYYAGQFLSSTDVEFCFEWEKLWRFSLPVRVESMSVVHDVSQVNFLSRFHSNVLSPQTIPVLRTHAVSLGRGEISFRLDMQQTGLPLERLPLTGNGRVSVLRHSDWIARRNSVESSLATAAAAEEEEEESPSSAAAPPPQQYVGSERATMMVARVPGASSVRRRDSSRSMTSLSSSGGTTNHNKRNMPLTLGLPSDADILSTYQVMLRQQIEAFQASEDDVQHSRSRINRVVELGQVGLRCRHCSGMPEWRRAPGSVYYPGSLDMWYQAGQNLAKNHICVSCESIPKHVQEYLNGLRADKKRAASGKEYWKKTALKIGIVERNNALWFEPNSPLPIINEQQKQQEDSKKPAAKRRRSSKSAPATKDKDDE